MCAVLESEDTFRPFSLGAPDVPLSGLAEEKERARRRSVNVFAAYEK